jgi:hypothetical protein
MRRLTFILAWPFRRILWLGGWRSFAARRYRARLQADLAAINMPTLHGTLFAERQQSWNDANPHPDDIDKALAAINNP